MGLGSWDWVRGCGWLVCGLLCGWEWGWLVDEREEEGKRGGESERGEVWERTMGEIEI
jgi:hypothetical protein